VNEPASPAGGDATAPDDDAARWQAAAQLRSQNPGWLIVWLARIGQFRAYPLISARRGTALTAPTTDELAMQIHQAVQAAHTTRDARLRPIDANTGQRGHQQLSN
jgi:hypothetical protein